MHFAQIKTQGVGGEINGSMPPKPFTNIAFEDSGKTGDSTKVGVMQRGTKTVNNITVPRLLILQILEL